MSFERSETRKGFTLIELLIVIAIILILIAIALPNFLEAKLRAVVTQVKGELRSLAIAAESYATDHQGQYPILIGKALRGSGSWQRGPVDQMYGLTSPIMYVSSDLINDLDPFYGDQGDPPEYHYMNRGAYKEDTGRPKDRVQYQFHSLGPDKIKGPSPPGVADQNWNNADYGKEPPAPYFDPTYQAWQYAATNGSRSNGDIIRSQF